MSLASKTLFVTGASRGIGLAIALRAARDGANVAIAAKTVKPDPRLPGTIFTRRRGDREGRRQGAAAALRHPRRAERRQGGGRDRGQVRRHRHPGEQRQRHQPHRHAGHADEALRPDAPDQRARHLPGLAEMHPASAEGRQPARAEPLAAARLRRQVVCQPSRPTRSPSSACRSTPGRWRRSSRARVSPSTACGRAPASPPRPSRTCWAARTA